MFTRRRKDAYEGLHPETKHGANQYTRGDEKFSHPSFAEDTATKTGVTARLVQLNAERGEKVCDKAIDLIRGTKLDTGTYLDKIKKVDREQQAETVARDLALHPEARAGATRARAANEAMGHNVDAKLASTFTANTAKATCTSERVVQRDAEAELSQTARRKAIYLVLHPETANGANQHTSLRKACEPSDRFTVDTAKATGQSERLVQLNAEAELSQTALRKAIYLALHPETAEHVAGGTGQRNGQFVHTVAQPFAADTAKAIGTDERTVRRDAQRGEAIEPEALDLIHGTALDTGHIQNRVY